MSGVSSTKLQGYKEVFPDMLARSKATGFEKISALVSEFETFLFKKNKGLLYRQEHLQSFSQLRENILG